MAADQLNYWDFVKAAFKRAPEIPGLGKFPAHPLALGAVAVLGILNPGFWLLGAAGEILYLALTSSNPRFQKLIRAQQIQAEQKGWQEQLDEAFERLSEASQARYRRLLEQSRAALGVASASEVATAQELRASSINQMLWIFVRLLSSREVLVKTMEQVRGPDLEAEVRTLKSRLEAVEENSPLFRSLTGTLEIQQRRLENRGRAEHNLAVVDAELTRIENHVELIREEAALGGGGKAGALSSRLDAVSSALTETDRWMEQNADILADIGSEPLASAPATLPQLPGERVETPVQEETVPDIPEAVKRRRRRLKE